MAGENTSVAYRFKEQIELIIQKLLKNLDNAKLFSIFHNQNNKPIMIKLTDLKPNKNNPRVIKDDKFKKLCKSIEKFPKMLELRPIVVDSDNVIVGGNMRYKALMELGMMEIPNEWVKKAEDFTEAELKEFVIKDNVSLGEWDWDELANKWNEDELKEWSVIQWKTPDYNPVLEPETIKSEITDKDVDIMAEQLKNQFNEASDFEKSVKILDIICPHCSQEFKLKI